MSENPRDTQFAGFAKAQWEKVASNVNRPRDFLVTAETLRQEEEQIIAHAAYDLVGHVLDHTAPTIYGYDHIPDLTELPKEPCNEK